MKRMKREHEISEEAEIAIIDKDIAGEPLLTPSEELQSIEILFQMEEEAMRKLWICFALLYYLIDLYSRLQPLIPFKMGFIPGRNCIDFWQV